MNLLVLVTRNEADLLRMNIAHHLDWGFDHVGVADNESTDATRDVLRGFGDAVTVTGVGTPDDRYIAFARLLATIEAERGPAEWVAVSDTDEFWWGPVAGIGEVLRRVPKEALAVNSPQKLFLPTAVDPPDGPVVYRYTHRASHVDSPLHTSYTKGKSVYRASWLRGSMLDSGHMSRAIPLSHWAILSEPLVHHYMIENEDAFVAKVTGWSRWEHGHDFLFGGPRAQRSTHKNPDTVAKLAWSGVYASRGEEGLRDYFRNVYVIPEPALRGHLAAGHLVVDRAFAGYARSRNLHAAALPSRPP